LSSAQSGRVVVIGGGIAGCSVAYHLALHGWNDVVLLEKGELTSGSTHHAAGLVTQFNPGATMMRFRSYSVELYERLGVFNRVGSVRIAATSDTLKELERAVSRAEAIGLEAELIGARGVLERLPYASPTALAGAVWMPGDGYVDPHIATHAVADAARALGVQIRTRSRVTGIELGPHREVRAVLTEGDGALEATQIVDAGGIWAPQLAAMVGARLTSVPIEHQHVLMHAVDGHEVPLGSPCFRDTDNLVYGKSEAGGMLIGGYEHNPVVRWIDGVPWSHGARPVPSDIDRFAPLLEGAIRRFPFLERAGVVRLLCHPDAMTPDGNPLIGPLPGIDGFWVAAGLSLNGFGAAGGIGRALAEWMIDGEPQLDLTSYRAWRFGRVYDDPVLRAECAREAYRYYYRLRYPLDSAELGRGRRPSPLRVRLQELGAVLGTKNGWERPDHFDPGRPWRRSGADQRAFGWRVPPWFERVRAEHTAFRERVGIIDMTSFGKLEVSGPGALALLDLVCDNRIDRPAGTIVYTQFLNQRGGIVADVTVTRLAHDRFRVITGAATVDSDRGWLELNRRAIEGGAEINDVTDELAVIGIWGPHSRAVVERATGASLSDAALPFGRAVTVQAGAAAVLAQRITYVGELGYELYVDPAWAVQLWDRLMAAGRQHGIAPGGYRALDSLRLEKGYRYFGSDISAADTPFESGLGFCVHLGKGEFNGRAALSSPEAQSPPVSLRTLTVGDGEYVTVYGGEAVRRDELLVGRIRSCGYGYTVGRMIALASVSSELPTGTELTVDVFGQHVRAVVERDVLHDPEGAHIRA
jgi:4-methylaminobutanoate oxidase (formaldehyde-forming)